MSSLTKTAYVARNVIKFGSIGVIGLALIWSGIVAAIRAYRIAKPTPPDIKFGPMPVIVFPQKTFETKNFTLELPKDSFPKFPTQAKVYVIYRPISILTALETDTQTANRLGFHSKPVEVKTGVYQFTKADLDQTLTMNVLDGSFLLTYPYKNDQILINSKDLPDDKQAISLSKNFLDSANKFPDDLEEGNQTITYWRISSQAIKRVSSFSEANATKVEFNRQNLDDKYPVVSSNPDAPPISILISASSVEAKRIIDVSYKYTPIDRQSFSTYPLRSVDQAWDDLKTGQYWPSRDSQNSSITIRNVYLAYYEPTNLTNFLQPIYVFEGDSNFVAYVSAIDPTQISAR